MTIAPSSAPWPCRLLDAAGQVVSLGQYVLLPVIGGVTRVRVTALDRPGAFVQRCVLGSRSTLVLELADGDRTAAAVESTAFDPAVGRSCLLTLEAPRSHRRAA
jgi:hypothetical protein